ncbi:biotin synthase BioB [Oerskovia turbata]
MLDLLVAQGLRGDAPTRDQALAVLRTGDADLLDVVAAAGRVRRHRFGRRVRLNYLVNLKSGLCPEDCGYCSQRLGSGAQILTYSWLSPEEAVAAARAGVAGGARRVCLVASGRGPSERDVARVGAMVDGIKAEHPGVEVCACLGLLRDGQAERLAAAGADAYNHNLNTSEAAYADICTTHGYADRARTVERARGAGLSPCSGLIAGMGESDQDLVDVAFALRDLGADSVPVNFLVPFEGTPLAGTWDLTPQRCLRILAMLRFVCPTAELRLGAGREVHLHSLQPLALEIVSSMFLGDYLTSEGQAARADLDLLADGGFEIDRAPGAVGAVEDAGPADVPGDLSDRTRAAVVGRARGATGVSVRRRGPGTDIAPNA